MNFVRSSAALFALALLSTGAGACASHGGDAESVEVSEEALVERKHLGVSDVTILYPLPSARAGETVDDLLAASSEGDRGELLPPAVFDQLAALESPPMLQFDGTTKPVGAPLLGRRAGSLADLRVVGIRLDPCFGESANLGSANCMNTIRLTTQFATNQFGNGANPDGTVGIHLFYSLTRTEFTALAKAMLALRLKAGLALQKGYQQTYRASSNDWFALGVHPSMAVEGLRGPYATGLRDLILSYAGEQNLTQVAFCVQDRGSDAPGYYQSANFDNRWVFGRFEVRAGALYALEVPSLSYTGLQWVDSRSSVSNVPNSNPSVPSRDLVVANPLPRTTDNFMKIFNNREANFDSSPSRSSAVNFQNPNKHTARTADCVSCHMADSALARVGQLGTDPASFKSPTYRLTASATGQAPFRMLGYNSAGQAILNQRVVNETAIVLDYLNRYVITK